MLLDLKFWWDGAASAAAAAGVAGPPSVQDTRVWLGGYDLSGALDSVNLAAARAEFPDEAYGFDIAGTYPGHQIVDAEVGGFVSSGDGEPETIAVGRVRSDFAEWPLTVCVPDDTGVANTDGGAAYNLRSAQFSMDMPSEHGALRQFSLRSRARTGLLDRGTVMIAKAARTATFTGTGRLLGSTASGGRLIAVLHVFDVTGGGSVTVTVQSSATSGFASPTTRGTFVAATGITREVKVISDVRADTYWRFVATWTPGTAYTLAAVAALEAA